MKFLKIAIFFIGLTTFAQSKVGAADIDYILSKMPEMETVRTQLETYAAQLDVDLNKKIDEYKVLAEAYKKGEANLTPEEKKTKQTELLTLDSDIQKFQQNGAKLMEIKRQEYLQPLYKKIGEALDKVAKAQGFTQVTQTNQDLIYLDPNYDLTIPILTELGITLTADEEEGE
jgi:outer membrane protein